MRYALFGRKHSYSEFVHISTDDLPWKEGGVSRNFYRGLMINSTYASGDNSLAYTEVSLENSEAYLDYKVFFLETRGQNQNKLQIGEIELPGVILPPSFSSVDIGSPPVSGTAINPYSNSWMVVGSGWENYSVSFFSRGIIFVFMISEKTFLTHRK